MESFLLTEVDLVLPGILVPIIYNAELYSWYKSSSTSEIVKSTILAPLYHPLAPIFQSFGVAPKYSLRKYYRSVPRLQNSREI